MVIDCPVFHSFSWKTCETSFLYLTLLLCTFMEDIAYHKDVGFSGVRFALRKVGKPLRLNVHFVDVVWFLMRTKTCHFHYHCYAVKTLHLSSSFFLLRAIKLVTYINTCVYLAFDIGDMMDVLRVEWVSDDGR